MEFLKFGPKKSLGAAKTIAILHSEIVKLNMSLNQRNALTASGIQGNCEQHRECVFFFFMYIYISEVVRLINYAEVVVPWNFFFCAGFLLFLFSM